MSLLYKECARIVGLVVSGKGSVKSLCLTTNNKAKTKVYAIVFNVLQNYSALSKIAKAADIECCAFVYVHLYELLYRGTLKTGGPLKSQLMKMLRELKQLKEQHQTVSSYKRLPLYVRINVLKVADPVAVIKQLQSDFPNTQFSGDCDVNFLLKFPPTTNFSQNSLYRSAQLILQDKASCLPAVVLDPPEGGVVLDACSAPGNKTLHLAAIMRNTGTVFAVERDRKRFKRLQQNLVKHGATTVVPICSNFLDVSPKDTRYKTVTHVLLDPTCSGSGMVTQKLTNFKPVDKGKLKCLADVQTSLLRHAMKFPNVSRIVYSTCSVHPEENEGVVLEVLQSQTEWELVKALPAWQRRGDTRVFVDADKCVRCSAEDDTNGFFLACFTRKDKDFLGGLQVQNVFSVQHLNMRYKLKHHYKYPYKFVKI